MDLEPSQLPWSLLRESIRKGFPGGSDGKESTYNAGDLGSIPGLGRFPGGGHGNPFQYSCLENPHGQRSLVGYSPWGRKESDMTDRLSTAQHIRKQRNLKRDVKERCVCVCVYVCVCVWDWLIHWLVREHFLPSRVVRCRIWRLLESRATFASGSSRILGQGTVSITRILGENPCILSCQGVLGPRQD